MDLKYIKVLKVDITDWLIKAIYSAKQHPDESDFTFKLDEHGEIIEFQLKHVDFDFFIDFDLYYDDCNVDEIDVSCEFKNYNHVSNLYPEPDMIDFDDLRLNEICKAVLSNL